MHHYYRVTVKLGDEKFTCDDCGVDLVGECDAVVSIAFDRNEITGIYCLECKKVSKITTQPPEEAESIDV